MTALEDIRAQLAAVGCKIELTNSGASIVGPVQDLTSDLRATARQAKSALIVELLRDKAHALKDFIDGDNPLAQRLSRLPDYLETLDRLADAQERLFDSWRKAGFKIMWIRAVEQFILVGDGDPPSGSENFAIYSSTEVAALKSASFSEIVKAHEIKKLCAGTVKRSESNGHQ
jgi:hypothetical protein